MSSVYLQKRRQVAILRGFLLQRVLLMRPRGGDPEYGGLSVCQLDGVDHGPYELSVYQLDGVDPAAYELSVVPARWCGSWTM